MLQSSLPLRFSFRRQPPLFCCPQAPGWRSPSPSHVSTPRPHSRDCSRIHPSPQTQPPRQSPTMSCTKRFSRRSSPPLEFSSERPSLTIYALLRWVDTFRAFGSSIQPLGGFRIRGEFSGAPRPLDLLCIFPGLTRFPGQGGNWCSRHHVLSSPIRKPVHGRSRVRSS